LEVLWEDCKLIIEENWPKEHVYCEILLATENIINELSKIDPTGTETRYSEKPTIKRKSKKSNKNDKIIYTQRDIRLTMEDMEGKTISLQNMRELMEKIYNFLNDMGDGISIELSNKRDNESEYNSD